MMTDSEAALLAKVASLHRHFGKLLSEKDEYGKRRESFKADESKDQFEILGALVPKLRQQIPHLYSDIPEYSVPSSYYGFSKAEVQRAFNLLEYILQVRSYSIPAISVSHEQMKTKKKVFLTHGRSLEWCKVRDFLQNDIGVQVVELEQSPNLGRSVFQKLVDESADCGAAVIVVTGEDATASGKTTPRGNVLHEIGYFQGKLGPDKICILFEEGTEIPSNIHGIVYIPFPKNYITATFQKLRDELQARVAKTK